jgi:hypothetical protein
MDGSVHVLKVLASVPQEEVKIQAHIGTEIGAVPQFPATCEPTALPHEFSADFLA